MDQAGGTGSAPPAGEGKPQHSAGTLPVDRSAEPPCRLAGSFYALYFAAPVLVYVAFSRRPEIHHDLWHQLALLRESAALGRLLTTEQYSYAAVNTQSIQHEWGAGAVALMLLVAGGSAALMMLKFALMLPVVLTAWLQARPRRGLWLPAALLGCLAAAMASYSNRPVCAQAYSVAIFSVLMWCLTLDRAGGRLWMAVFAPLFVAWVNLHGGFVVGLGVLGAHTVEQVLRKRPWLHLALYLPLLAATVALNPYGLKFYPNIVHGLTMSRPIITEWRPFWAFTSVSSEGTIFIASLLMMLYVLWKIGPRRFCGWLVLLLLAAATLKAQKVLPLYALAWFCALVGALPRIPLARATARFARVEPGTVLVALLTLAVVSAAFATTNRFWKLRVPGLDQGNRFDTVYPVGPVDHLRAVGFQGNLMTPFEQGAYVSWKLYPAVKVGCDSRYEVAYEPKWVEEVSSMYLDASYQGWRSTLERYPTDVVLVKRSMVLAARLEAAHDWHRFYRDDTWELIARPGLVLPPLDRSGEAIEGTIP